MNGRVSILFVNQHYWPDVASTGQHLTDLAEYLAARDFDVTVLCHRGGYEGGVLDAAAREARNGVTILRVGGKAFGRRSRAGRLADYASFMLRVLVRTGLGRRYDIIVFLTTPSLLSSVGLVLRASRGQRYGIWSMDLHPEVEANLGILPRGGLTRVFRAIGDASCRHAAFVVALGACMRERLLEKGVAPDALQIIPVWNRKGEIEPVPKEENPLVRELGLSGRFVVMYSGNAGLAHRFEEVLTAMEHLNGTSGIEFVFVGGGPRKGEILAGVEGRVTNFRYLGYRPREELRNSLSVGDVHLVTLREDMAGLVVPGKLYGIMAAGRPVVMVGPRASDTARTIEEEGVGIVIDPADGRAVDRLVEALLRLKADHEERERMGKRGRESFLEKYERDVTCRQWAELLHRVQAGGKPAVPHDSFQA